MTPEDLRKTLLSLLADIAPDADLDDVEDDESLREQLDIDSMDLLRFAQGIHDTLGVDVPEIDQPKLDRLEVAVPWLLERLPAQG